MTGLWRFCEGFLAAAGAWPVFCKENIKELPNNVRWLALFGGAMQLAIVSDAWQPQVNGA